MASIGSVQIDFIAGLAGFQRSLDQMVGSLGGVERTLNAAFNSVRNLVGGIALGAVVKEAVQLADSFANLTARLKIATAATGEFEKTFNDVFAIAQRTSASLVETANLYGRVSSSLQATGKDASAANGIVETINKTLALSGATAASSAAAIIQLNQAFASGVLRGEEFNSVAEQAPLLLQGIAKELGLTIGQLRAVAAEGKLTTDVVIQAIQGLEGDVAAKFAQLPQTVSASFQQLSNEVLVAVGRIDQELNSSQGLSKFVQSIGAGVRELSTSFVNAIPEIAGYAKALGLIVAAIVGLAALRGVAGLIAGTSAAIVASAAAQRAALIATASAGDSATAATLRQVTANNAAAASTVARTQTSLNAITTARAESLARLAVAQAAVAQSSSLANLQALQAASTANAAKLASLAANEVKLRATLAAATAAQASAQAALNTTQAAALGVGARLAAGVASLGTGLLNLVGGSIGAVILGLGGLVFWLSRTAAEQQRVEQQTLSTASALEQFAISAQSGTLGQLDFQGTTKAINDQSAAIADLKDNLARLQQVSVRGRGGTASTFGTPEEIARARQELLLAETALVRLQRASQSAADNGLTALGNKLRGIFSPTTEKAAYEFGLSLADLDKRIAGYAENLDPIAALQAKFTAELEAATKAGKDAAAIDIIKRGQAQELEKARKSLDGYKNNLKATTKAQDELKRAVDEGVQVFARLQKEFDPLGALAEEQADAMIALSKAFGAGKLSADQLAQAIAQLGRERRAAEQDRADSIQLIKRETDSVDELIKSLRRETEITNAQNIGDREKIRLLELEERIRREIASLPDDARENLAPERRAQIEAEVTAAYDAAKRQTFDFGQSLSDAINDAFRTGSLSAGFRGFVARLKEAFGGGVKNAVAAVGNALNFAAPIIDAFRSSDGNRLGSGVRALTSALAATGNPFAIAASAIDAIAGGRLFGTDYERNQSGFNVAFGSGGFTGSQFLEETRQRSLFRGTARRTTVDDLDAGTEKALRDFFKQINTAVALAAADLGVSIPSLIEGAFEEVTDKSGKVIKQFSTVLGRVFEETFEEFQQRLLAENIIATIDQLFKTAVSSVSQPTVPPGVGFDEGGAGGGGGGDLESPRFLFNKGLQSLVGEASAIAERFRADAATLLDGAQFLLAAATDIKSGVGLLGDGGTLTQIADLIEDLQAPGEALVDTYKRVSESSDLFTRALDLAGITLDLTREGFVRFATDITDAAGGLERASSLWSSYYNTFYSDTERAQLQFAQATQRLNDELADVGLDPTATQEQFRAIFESALAAGTLTPEQIVQYLEAAEAFGLLDEAVAAVAEAATAANEALDAAAEALDQHMQAIAAYADFFEGIDQQIRSLDGSSEFIQSIRAVETEFQANIRTANELARAAGRQGAAEGDLVKIHELAARRVAAAVAQLRGRIQGLVSQLYNPVDAIERQIQELQAAAESSSSAELGGIDEVAQAQADRYEAELEAIKDIQGFLDSLRLDTSLTTLTPQARVSEAQGQFSELLAAAQGGDIEALQQLSGAAQAYLREARSFFASGDEYTRIFDFVTGALGALTPTGTPVSTTPGTGGSGSIDTSASIEIQRLEKERERLQKEAEAAQRQAQALELIGFLRELAAATGEDILALASSFNIPLQTLVTDLGVNLDSLTAGTTQTLAGIAQSLGIELTDLARSVGVDLGSLADDQSLLNDALEAQINALPPASAAALQPYFDAIAEATTDADANEAIGDLVDAANEQPEAIRRLLAPYLDDLDFAEEFTDLDFLESISSEGGRTAVAAESIDSTVQQILQRLSDPSLPGNGGIPDIPGTPGGPSEGESEIIGAIQASERSNNAGLAQLSARVAALETAQKQSVLEQVKFRETVAKAR